MLISNRKKLRREKQKKRGGERAKRKSQDCCVTFNPKNYLEILLSEHPQTSQANILHLNQEAAKCTTCERICGTYNLSLKIKARQLPEHSSAIFKTHFLAKFPGANGLMKVKWQ